MKRRKDFPARCENVFVYGCCMRKLTRSEAAAEENVFVVDASFLAVYIMTTRPQTWASGEESSAELKRRKPGEGHSAPPSQVVHVRNVSDGTREHDLIGVVKSFGKVTYVTLMARHRQALIEFEDIEAATNLVQFNKNHDIQLLGRPAFFNFSLSQNIKRAGQAGGPHQEYAPNKILLFTILNPMYPITASVLHSIAQRHGEVQRIAIFHKNGVQALVELATVEQAVLAKETLDNADIYAGCCTLKIEFSKADRVNVSVNNEESWDYTGSGRRVPLHPTPRGSGVFHPNSHGPIQSYSYDGYGSHIQPQAGAQQHYTTYGGADFPHPAGDNYRHGMTGAYCHESGAVLMVYNLDPDRMNCDKIFNIFCAYGNILRIKILIKKTGAAMVQMDRREGAMNAIKLLNQVELMGRPLQISFSHHSSIEDRGLIAQLTDGTPAVIDYASSRNNRFMSANQSRKNLMIPPTQVLHFFNAPPVITEDGLKTIFKTSLIRLPLLITVFDKKSESARTSGLMEWSNAVEALEAMALVNHTPLRAASGQVFTLKLAFSMSPPRILANGRANGNGSAMGSVQQSAVTHGQQQQQSQVPPPPVSLQGSNGGGSSSVADQNTIISMSSVMPSPSGPPLAEQHSAQQQQQ
eukprot:scpid69652/ scgid27300/ Heterogeneous nuclear ribonucleoprotein L